MWLLKEKRLTSEDLIDDLEIRSCQERGLVIMTVGQWESITEAYSSPLVKRIAASCLSIYPGRDVETKKPYFIAFSRNFMPKKQ